jgi:demethylmenaquinone methyltransferase/2-methoxy-6-polyprenyl-1,4-benzoquinol methylase
MFDHFAFVAPIYDKVIRLLNVKKLKELMRLPVHGRLLDAGGGTGRVSSHLKPWVDEVVVSDLSRSMLKQAGIKRDLLPVQAHAEKLPFADESFERVLVVDALHHFCDQEQALADLLRVLKPGGRLVIEEPNVNRLLVKFLAAAEKLMLMGSRFLSPGQIAEVVQKLDLSAKIESDGGLISWIVVVKPL